MGQEACPPRAPTPKRSGLSAGAAARLPTGSEEPGNVLQQPSSPPLPRRRLRRREGHRGVGPPSKTRGLCEFSVAKRTK